MVKSFTDLVAWIKAEVAPSEYGAGTAEEAAMWFCAYQMATEYNDANTIKDWARMLVAGFQPLSTTDCTEWILTKYGDDEWCGHDDDASVNQHDVGCPGCERQQNHDADIEVWKHFEGELNMFFFANTPMCSICEHAEHEDGQCYGMVGKDPCDCRHMIEGR